MVDLFIELAQPFFLESGVLLSILFTFTTIIFILQDLYSTTLQQDLYSRTISSVEVSSEVVGLLIILFIDCAKTIMPINTYCE